MNSTEATISKVIPKRIRSRRSNRELIVLESEEVAIRCDGFIEGKHCCKRIDLFVTADNKTGFWLGHGEYDVLES